jgi:predicted RecA/RadA family phage recombinase
MAHPSFSFPKGFYDINEVSVSATDDFYAIHCYAAGNITVEGGSRFEYVDIDNAAAGTVNKYINPDTGKPFANVVDGGAGDEADGKAAGFYELIESQATTIALAAGQTVYGSFSKITTPASGNASVIAYNK